MPNESSGSNRINWLPWGLLFWGGSAVIMFHTNVRDAFVVPPKAKDALWVNSLLLWNNSDTYKDSWIVAMEATTSTIDGHPTWNSSLFKQHQNLTDENGLDLDTTLIITSSLIPTHPSIAMIKETISSLTLLQGLSPKSPIYITVDGIPDQEEEDTLAAKDREDRIARRNGYIRNLRHEYRHKPHIHILVSEHHRHIAGSIKWAFDTAPPTAFYYMIQHDFPFNKVIDHTNIRKSMLQQSNHIRCVRFNYKIRNASVRCGAGQPNVTTPSIFNINGLNFYLTVKWSDNNHIASREYYNGIWNTFANYTGQKLPVEWILMPHVRKNCFNGWGQWIYGKYKGPGETLRHLDGRNRKFVDRGT
eukprot:scaffold896_cov172-Amphora_coffeaeformis.AAC.21